MASTRVVVKLICSHPTSNPRIISLVHYHFEFIHKRNSLVITEQGNQCWINPSIPLLCLQGEQHYYFGGYSYQNNKYACVSSYAIKQFRSYRKHMHSLVAVVVVEGPYWGLPCSEGVLRVVFIGGWGVTVTYICVCTAADKPCLQESDCYRSQNKLSVRELNDS